MAKAHNFTAGPCILPEEVFSKASKAAACFTDDGLSILEISHRSPAFVDIMSHTRQLVKEVLNIPDGYQVLFLQGGASLGFLYSVVNFMKEENGSAAYVNTGAWSTKAIKEAKIYGEAKEIASSKDKNFNYIPKGYEVPTDVDYLHITSNNTIAGTQFKKFPNSSVPMICDMSSDIFSKPIDVSKFAMIYAGAQKNMGPAGATLYIVKEELLGKTGRNIPAMLDLKTHIKKDSSFNTPPVFSIYASMLNLEWLKKEGGVEEMKKRNEAKAELLYNEIDENPMFKAICEKEDRSTMNATFLLDNEEHKAEFDKMINDAKIVGLNGHRSVGGYRASMYNALTIESVQVLVDVMKVFTAKFN